MNFNSKIAIDVDEVLVHLLKPMVKFHKKQMPKKCNYLYREVFNCSEEESQKLLKQFYFSEEFRKLEPIDGSVEAMKNLKRVFPKMYVVTGRQDMIREPTELWLNYYFPEIFDDILLTNSFTSNEINKADICRSLAIDLLIDDNVNICKQCIENGTEALNFIGSDSEIYPWCEESDISLHGWKRWNGLLFDDNYSN